MGVIWEEAQEGILPPRLAGSVPFSTKVFQQTLSPLQKTLLKSISVKLLCLSTLSLGSTLQTEAQLLASLSCGDWFSQTLAG